MNTQTITHPANRFDAVAVCPQPATQSGNLDIDRPLRGHLPSAGEAGKDLLAAKCLSRMAGQQPQESEFRNGQSDRPVANPHLVPARVYRDALYLNGARTRLAGSVRASQQRPDFAEKQLLIDGVCHVVICAKLQCRIKTGHVGKPQVDEDQINISGSGQRQSLPTCRSGHYIETGRIQSLAVLLSDLGVTLYYEYADAGH